MPAEYTGLTLTAGQALLQNQGLRTPLELTAQVNSYAAIPALEEFKSVLDTGNVELDSTTYQSLATLGSNSLPALTDVISSDYANSLGAVFRSNNLSGLSGFVLDRADYWLGYGDLSKFAQYIAASQSYISTGTSYIAAAMNSDQNDAVFNYPGADNYITAGISDLSMNLSALGQDIQRAGHALNFAEINLLGSPILVLRSLSQQGGVPNGVINALVDAVVTPDYIAAYQVVGQSGLDSDNQVAYQVFGTITGDLLRQCLRILQVTTLNITSLADLLDPKKLFPNTWPSLTVKVAQSKELIYLPSGAVNPNLPNLGSRLDFILPDDIAQAWLAIARGLTDVKGIENTTALIVGPVIQNLQTVSDLPMVQDFTEPVPGSVRQYWTELFATGTGPGNSVQAWDLLGTAVGDPAVQDLQVITPVLANLDTGTLIGNTGIYHTMANVLAGSYGPLSGPVTIPPEQPAAGTYGNANLAFSMGLVPTANLFLANIANTVTDIAEINNLWGNIQHQLLRENQFLDISGLVEVGAQPDSEVSTLALTTNLHNLGQNVGARGYANLLAILANTTTLGGQAIAASLREGQNIQALDRAGILLDSGLSPSL